MPLTVSRGLDHSGIIEVKGHWGQLGDISDNNKKKFKNLKKRERERNKNDHDLQTGLEQYFKKHHKILRTKIIQFFKII